MTSPITSAEEGANLANTAIARGIIATLEGECAHLRARSTTAESEVSRLTERLAKVEAERDEARAKIAEMRREWRHAKRLRDLLRIEASSAAESRDAARRSFNAAESSASDLAERVASLEAALSLTLAFTNFAAGEGIAFLSGPDHPEMDAADICAAVAETLGIELGGPDYMAIIAARAALKESRDGE